MWEYCNMCFNLAYCFPLSVEWIIYVYFCCLSLWFEEKIHVKKRIFRVRKTTKSAKSHGKALSMEMKQPRQQKQLYENHNQTKRRDFFSSFGGAQADYCTVFYIVGTRPSRTLFAVFYPKKEWNVKRGREREKVTIEAQQSANIFIHSK